MPRLGLAVGCIGQGSTIPLTPDVLGGIINRFFVASKGAIDLDPRMFPEVSEPARPAVSAYYLHRETAKLTENATVDTGVRRIALLYSNFYAPEPSAFGVMFDRGFATSDDPNSSSQATGVAREACAVFLGAIDRLKSPANEKMRQVVYTTTHELGHVFNLIHRAPPDPPNLMMRSPSGTRAPTDAFFDFVDLDREWLSRAGVDRNVWPGGLPFRDRAGAESGDLPLRRTSNPLQLSISSSRQEFPLNEPIELAIRLSLRPKSRAALVSVPDEIDPGYPSFRIWIEDPDGELRLYRPINRYCSAGRALAVTRAHPFSRDISLFGQSGGFTFSKLGVHHVTCELVLPAATLRSNRVPLHVLPPRDDRTIDIALVHSRRVQRLFFYRQVDHVKDALNLADQANDVASKPLAGFLRYSIARCLGSADKTPAQLVRLARENAERALDLRDFLGMRQVHHLERALERFGAEGRHPRRFQFPTARGQHAHRN